MSWFSKTPRKWILVAIVALFLLIFAGNGLYVNYVQTQQITPLTEAQNFDSLFLEYVLEYKSLTNQFVSQEMNRFFATAVQGETTGTTILGYQDILIKGHELLYIAQRRNNIHDHYTDSFNQQIDSLEAQIKNVQQSVRLFSEIDNKVRVYLNELSVLSKIIIQGTNYFENISSQIITGMGLAHEKLHEAQDNSNTTLEGLMINSTIAFTHLDGNFTSLLNEFVSFSYAASNILNETITSSINNKITTLNAYISQDLTFLANNFHENAEQIQIVDSLAQLLDLFNTDIDGARIAVNNARSATQSALTNANQIYTTLESLLVVINQIAANLLTQVNSERSHSEELQQGLNRLTFRLIAILLVVMVVLGYILYSSIFTPLTQLQKRAQRVGEGELNVELFNPDPSSRNELDQIKMTFDFMVSSMKSLIAKSQEVAESVSGIAEELAAGAEEASSSVQEVSAAMNEISSGANEQTHLLIKVSDELAELLTRVEQVTEDITGAANFVLKIAKQTNILGLNASIEAAKAGMYGRGFNVVAEHVRELAENSRDKADEIANLIEEIGIAIRRTMIDIVEAIEHVRDVAEQTAAGTEEANAASEEQTSMMEEISDTAAQLAKYAQELTQLMSRFRV